jgi:preprotein translocase subunit SecD
MRKRSTAQAVGSLVGVFLVLAAVVVFFLWVRPIGPSIRLGLDLKGGVRVVLQTERPATPQEMSDVLRILTNRADALGVSEPVIEQQGSNEFVIELAGVKNQEEAIRAIGQTGLLQFEGARYVSVSTGKKGPPQTVAVPDGKAFVTGRELVSAQAGLTPTTNVPAVFLTFNSAGAQALANYTSSHIGQPLFALLDHKVINEATIQEAIPNGQAMIQGLPSLKDAQQLANLLNSGALPVPLRTIEIQAVSALLGADSVHASEVAGLIAMSLIVVLMVVFYRFAGLLADLALLLYLMVLAAVLIGIHAVITLPGVAGVILSAGIAVDANVIIFARVRDELRAGRSTSSAIEHGFRNALRAIADSNVSALAAAVVLYYFGIGDVRGFALTLAIGVCISFLTAYFFTRWLIRLVEGTSLTENLSFFVGYRAPAAQEVA